MRAWSGLFVGLRLTWIVMLTELTAFATLPLAHAQLAALGGFETWWPTDDAGRWDGFPSAWAVAACLVVAGVWLPRAVHRALVTRLSVTAWTELDLAEPTSYRKGVPRLAVVSRADLQRVGRVYAVRLALVLLFASALFAIVLDVARAGPGPYWFEPKPCFQTCLGCSPRLIGTPFEYLPVLAGCLLVLLAHCPTTGRVLGPLRAPLERWLRSA